MDKERENRLQEHIKKIQALYKRADKQKRIFIGWKLSGGKID